LKGEVAGNYGANKKLVGLVSKKSNKGPMTIDEQEDLDAEQDNEDIDAFLQDADDLSFLQKKQTRSQRKVVLRKMMSFLRTQAKTLKSDSISALMIRMKEDHFVKVRGMIKDMIAKLEADAAAEGDQKAWCDSEMEKATSKRDENIGESEGDLAAKTKAEAAVAKLKEEIQKVMLLVTLLVTLHLTLSQVTSLETRTPRQASSVSWMSSNQTLRAPSRLQRPLKVMQSLHSTTTRVRQRQISPTRRAR